MVLKLILLIASLVAFSFFTGLNLDNKCDIWFFWTTFKNVPVFLTAIISFAAGALFTLPLALKAGSKNDDSDKEVSRKTEKGLKKIKSSENNITYDRDK